MIQRIHLLSCIQRLTAGASAEQIAEQQRQADIKSQMDDNDSESDDADSASKSINHSVSPGGGVVLIFIRKGGNN